MTMPNDPVLQTRVVLEKIREAWYAGRPIVPIIGAGFSANSGFPILSSICRYLARFIYAINHNLLLPSLSSAKRLKQNIQYITEAARTKPIEYIEHFNWPDRFKLTQLLAQEIHVKEHDRKAASQHQLIEEAITQQYAWLAKNSCSQRVAQEWENREKGENGEEAKLRFCDAWDRWALQGDWRRLIQFFTSYNDDHADALFARFGYLRNPGLGHRYLVLLVKLLSIHHIFTFNFDDLIEQALTLDDVPHHIFGMEHGLTLPNRRVTEDVLSVIKMHGSHHSILIDERLDRPLKPPYVRRFYDLAGYKPLLLILGCSGDDRRLEDLLAGASTREVDLCWVHFEPEPPISKRIQKTYKRGHEDRLHVCPTNNPTAFLRHLLFDLSGRFPASPRPYSSYPSTPTIFGKPGENAAKNLLKDEQKKHSFESKLGLDSSEKMLELAAACANKGFAVIWIDVESLHTLAGVVGAVIDACRVIDPELPPAVMPVGEEKVTVGLERLEHALQRHHYAVFIDAIGTYGSRALMHHSTTNPEHASDRAERFSRFLEDLTQKSLGQSIVVASKVTHAPRRSSKSEEILASGDKSLLKLPRRFGEADNPLIWFCLACVRRTRALPSVRRLLAPMIEGGLRDERLVDDYVKRIVSSGGPLHLLEGGEVWFERQDRDSVYEHATRFSSSAMLESLRELKYSEYRAATLAQSLLIAFLHRKIASTYFSFEFMQSRDAQSFLEYTYHRISSIRYFSRAIYLLNEYATADLKLFAEARAHIDRIPKPVAKFSWGTYFGDPWNKLQDADGKLALGYLREQRECELESLLASWMECEHEVRSQIPAETLLQWIDEILDNSSVNDSGQPLSESGEGLKRMLGVFVGAQHCPDTDDNKTMDTCKTLETYFGRLRLRIGFERGAFEVAMKQAEKAKDATTDHTKEWDEAMFDLIEICVRGGNVSQAERLLTLMNQELEQLQDDERGHRFRHMRALVQLGGPSWLAFQIEEGILKADVDPEAALRIAEAGIQKVRGHGAMLAKPLEGMTVSSGSPGGAYCPYRSVFRILKGRAVMGLMLRTTPSRPLTDDLADFRRAMRQFDQARAGLPNQYSLLSGWADLHAAESALLLVHRTFDRKSPSIAERLGIIRAKLLSCRMHLQNAISAVRTGRRNALWWRHCYQLIAQYHAESLYWNLYELKQLSETNLTGLTERAIRSKHMIAHGRELFKRYEKYLEAIVGFADYSIQRDKAFEDQWLQRTFTKVIYGAARAVHLQEELSKNRVELFEIVDDIINDWKHRHPRAYYGNLENIIKESMKANVALVSP